MNASARTSEPRGTVLYEEPMARHTTWHVGGPAEVYFKPADIEDLAGFLTGLDPATPVHWFGLGSNVLVRDGGLRGVVVATHKVLGGIERLDEQRVRAEAGVACARLARQCAGWQIGPAQFFAGIPGTVGGALAMNAGAFGGETWNHVERVEVMGRDGRIVERGRDEYDVGYRHVAGPAQEWFLAATFAFDADASAGRAAIRELLERRKRTQPITAWSCGSVFRNPPGDHAARLIQAAGLKGFTIGGASVSEKHANFILNEGEATAQDIEQLIVHVRNVVRARFDVDLIPEVRIVGDPA